MAKISVCVITKDEEKNIRRCLQSVKNIANEIIVVDTGSTDATVTIAEEFGAKIFYYQWNNDFAAARNYALAQAGGAWIIFLDADEYIAAETINNVRPFIDKIHGNRKIEAISCLMRNLEGVDGPLRSSNPSIRIFRNSPLIRYQGRIHEAVYKSGKPLKLIGVTDQSIVVYHTGYTRKNIFEKLRRNTELLEEEVKSGVIRDMTYCYLSDSYWRYKEYEKAIDYAQKAIKQMAKLKSELDYKPYVYLVSSMTRMKTYSEDVVLATCKEALARFPHHPEIWLYQGIYYWNIGCCEQALASLLKAIEANANYKDFHRNNDFYGLSQDAYSTIAQIYEMKNQPAKALDYYIKVLQWDKLNQTAFKGLVSLIRNQDPADVIYFLNRIYNTAAEKEIRFLIENLSKLKVKKVLDYYHQILLTKFDDKNINGVVLLTNCSFEKAFPVLANSFRVQGSYEMELLAVAALISNGNPALADLLGPRLRPAFRKIITAYFQIDKDVQLMDEDCAVFCDLLREIMYLGSQKQVETFLELGKKFFLNKVFSQISTLLLQERFFGYTLDMVLYYINNANLETSQLSLLYCDAGYCCYRLKDFSEAAKYFERALELGDRRHYIFDFLEWSFQQCPDEKIKRKLRMMKEGLTTCSNK
ncbi:glycosyltransferase [Sporomusa sp. KB1]|uniref:glycosyltransferase n=1 Tax=Sporomusa sp. KB1 TaxID=943346 RepID=UPI00119F9B9B|nr:glycosyltransferase [Sporomusa sp. KB1]TWH47393.1 glycosyltransferase involved in cell wall biosynthesis [Sporomusa sp. KB1]